MFYISVNTKKENSFRKLSEFFLKPIINKKMNGWLLILGLITLPIVDSVHAEQVEFPASNINLEHKDPAPLPDFVIQKLLQSKESAANIGGVREVISRNINETVSLLGSIKAANKNLLTNKIVLLESKVNEFMVLRDELSTQIEEKQAKYKSKGNNKASKKWAKRLKRVNKKFNKLIVSLNDVHNAKTDRQRSQAIVKAEKQLKKYEGKYDRKAQAKSIFPKIRRPAHTYPGYVPPLDNPVPTMRLDPPKLREDPSKETKAPQYMASPRVPLNIFASLDNIILADAQPTPVQAASCNYTADDLAENTEIQLTQEIRDLAKKLRYSPARIFEYVNNNIEFEPYYGSLKGGMGTLVSGGGNATDQASLTIALLRAANIPARYVKGQISFDKSDPRLFNWVGAKTWQAAANIFAQGKIPVSTAGTVSLSHVWVEACVPYNNYRGAAYDLSGHRWIPLDPSFKNKSYQDGIQINIDFDYDGYMSIRSFELPHEHFAYQVKNHIRTLPPRFDNNTLDDVAYKGNIVPQKVDILPASLPYEVVSYREWAPGLPAEIATIPDEHRYTFRIEVMGNGGAKGNVSLYIPEIVLNRTTLSYEQGSGSSTELTSALNAKRAEIEAEYGVGYAAYFEANGGIKCVWDYMPVIKVEGVVKNSILSASPFCYHWVDEWYGGEPDLELVLPQDQLYLKVLIGENTSEQLQVNKANFDGISVFDYRALHAYAFQGSDRLIAERANKLLQNVNTIADPATNKDDTLGEFLHLVGLKYMRYISDANKFIAGIYGQSGHEGNHLGLTASRSQVDYLFDLPYAVRDAGFVIDVPGQLNRSIDLETGGSRKKPFVLNGYAGSMYESYVWQENARMDAVSSVRGIQFANDKGIEVLTIDQTNLAIEITKLTSNTNPDLDYSETSVTNITNEVNSGATVIIPRSLIEYGNWKGQVYIATKGSDGGSMSAQFAISSFAGGYTVTPPFRPYNNSASDISVGYNNVPKIYQSAANTRATPELSSITAGRNLFNTIAGDPVNMVTGNMYHTERDINIKGRGLPIAFERTYNSLIASQANAASTPLGYGWTHSFNQYLEFNDDDYDSTDEPIDSDGLTSSVIWVDGSWSRKFIKVAGDASGVPVGSSFTAPEGYYFTAERLSNGQYKIREKNGLTYIFESVAGTDGQIAKLKSIQDRNGNTLTLNYLGNELQSVTDGLNRTLSFVYVNGRIDYIQDWGGRRHEYKYNALGELTEYHNPLAVAGSQPPVTYTYYSSADGENLNHAMRSYNLPRGNGMTFEYYMNGRTFRHYNTLGESMTFTYNDFRREATTVDHRGFTKKYFFNEKGNPTKVIEEDGSEESFTYDPLKPMSRTGRTDHRGYDTGYIYDAKGNLEILTNPSGSTVEYSHFNSYNQAGKIKDANGNYALYKFDASGNRTDVIALKAGIGVGINPVTYAPVASQILAWSKTSYDSYGNPLVVKQIRDFNTQEGPTIEFGYNDAVNNVNGLNGVSVTKCGDRNGDGVISRSTECVTESQTFDNLGRLRNGVRGDWYRAQTEYDSVDRVKRATDGVGNMRDYSYDDNGNPEIAKLMLDINGSPTLLDQSVKTYDMSDRVDTAMNAGGFLTYYEYDAAGNVKKVTNPDNYSVSFDYDAKNRAVKTYDEEGNAASRDFDSSGRVRKITYPDGSFVRFEYYGPEKDGRLKRRYDALGRFVEFDYDANGNVSKVTDNVGRITLTDYDALGRAERVVGPMYTDSEFGDIRPVTKYTYGNLGNVTIIKAGYTDATGTYSASDVVSTQETSTYDDFGQRLTKTDPLQNTWRYQYDLHGNLKKITDPKNQIVEYTYFYGGRLDTQTVSQYEGDPNPHITKYTYYELGQIKTIESPEVTYTYHYDAAHRGKAITDSRGGKRIEYDYSPGGLLNSMSDNEGKQTQYLYDPAGRLTGIWAPNDDMVTYIYDSNGRLAEKWFTNGVNTRYSYNADNSLSQLVNRSYDGTTISQHDYTYDGVGNIDTHLEQINGSVSDYKYIYDALDRLSEVRNNSDNSLIESYTYDPLNNRKTLTKPNATLAYVYDADKQYLLEVRQNTATGTLLTAFVYDQNGALVKKCDGGTVTRTDTDCTGDSVLELTYDALDRLTGAIKTNLAAESYSYDPLGNRIEKTVGTATNRYRYNGPDIIAEYGASWDTPTAYYTHGPLWDDPLIRATADSAQYFHQDGLGSVVAVSNKLGAVQGSASYDAWGNVNNSVGSIPQYGYTGREPDATGLIYYRARYYDPSIGRFTQRDPKGFIDGINQYVYAINNPVNYTDPTGTSVRNDARTNYVTQNANYILGTTMTAGSLASSSQSLGSMARSAAAGTLSAPVVAATVAVGSMFYPSPSGGCDGNGYCSSENPPRGGGSSSGLTGGTGNPDPCSVGLCDEGSGNVTKGAKVNWKSVKEYGHTFKTHGAGPKNTNSLIGRAAGTGKNQGQWLNNQKAAEFLKGVKVDGPATVRIPDGLGRVITPNGSFVNAQWARVVPNANGLRTAFPIIP